MKKVTGILAVVVMTIGLASTSIQNSNEFDFINDISNALACDDCDVIREDNRKPPKRIA